MRYLVPFSYQGSKIKQLSRIRNIIGTNISICESFFGSGIITGRLGKNQSCIMNEKSVDVFSIWKCVYENNKIFFNLIRDYCSEENRFPEYYYKKRKEYNKFYNDGIYSVYRTALFFYVINSCHGGLMRYGPNGFNTSYKFYLSNGRKYNIKERIKSLKSFSSKFQSINNEDALDFLKKNHKCDIIYCDPPYINSSSHYENDWTKEKYLELIEICKFQWDHYRVPSLISNYSNVEFDILYDECIKFETTRMAGTFVVNKKDILGIIGTFNKFSLKDFME